VRAQLDSPIQVNLQRLLRWHGLTNANAAVLLGSTRHTVGDWLSGRRTPGTSYLMDVARLFGVDPRDLYSDPRSFGAVVSDPARLAAMNELEWKRRGWSVDEWGIAWGPPNA
jgi:transcriptional regulator with XRE-family HTH domain